MMRWTAAGLAPFVISRLGRTLGLGQSFISHSGPSLSAEAPLNADYDDNMIDL